MRSRVLVVEDDDRIRAALRLALVDEGHDVDDVGDAESALERLRDDRRLDLAEVILPGMSARFSARRLRPSGATRIGGVSSSLSDPVSTFEPCPESRRSAGS